MGEESPKSKRKRDAPPSRETGTYSDYEESSDDDVDLDARQRMRALMRRGGPKAATLRTQEIERDKDSAVIATDPRARKRLAAARSDPAGVTSPSDALETMSMLANRYHMQAGLGFFITPGGNREPGGETITEAPAAYRELFPRLTSLGEDANLRPLYQMATGHAYTGTGATILEPDLAQVLLFLNTRDLGLVARALPDNGGRTQSQLLADASKFLAICVAEVTRAMRAVAPPEVGAAAAAEIPAPYDASLFVNRGLKVISEGSQTFENVFFKGPHGGQSIFLGAPALESGAGGSHQLQHPLSAANAAALERQMSIFPTQKGAFKRSLNELAIDAPVTSTPLSAERRAALERALADRQVAICKAFAAEIAAIGLPTKRHEAIPLIDIERGTIRSHTKHLRSLRRKFKGNAAALEALVATKAKLGELRHAALKAMDNP